jgi:hypothetical protein
VSLGPIERLALYFGSLRSRQGLLARAALGAPARSDAALARELAMEMTAELRPDDTIGGAAVPTIWRAHELMDLGSRAGDQGVARSIKWIMERQDGPGAYGEGCDKTRHAHRVCEHWIGGFFAPASAERRLAPITLPNGKVFRAEPAARFAISALGLRAVLRAGLGDRPGVIRHLESLRVLAEQWTEWTGFFAPDVIVAGVHALALGGEEYRPTVETVVATIASHQRVDGLWPNADLFHTLEALLATGLPEAQAAVRQAAPALAERQRADGTFGAMAQQERSLIGLRALLWGESIGRAAPVFPGGGQV